MSSLLDSFRRLKVEEGNIVDRLTDLPIDIKHQIQEHLSVDEAARMSVLSSPWRHVWASIPKLLFSPDFCNNNPSTLIRIISTILQQHVGAIKTFVLDISSIPPSQHSLIDQWILFLSRNGIMDLTLHNRKNKSNGGNGPPYKLPSDMCTAQLQRLDLSNCIFRPPCSFSGSPKLKELSLFEVALELDLAASFLRMPDLESLQFVDCSGIHHLKIYAPKLWLLVLLTIGADTLMLGHFADCRELKSVCLEAYDNQDKPMDLTKLFSGWPKLTKLNLNSYYLKSLSCDDGTRFNSLRLLSFYIFNFYDKDQISSLLRMLRSSPDLKKIILSLDSNSKKKDDMEESMNLFEGRPGAYMTGGLNKLQILEILNFHGSRTELLFVKFILASAPLLLKTILRVDRSVDARECLKISKELLEFPRASPKVGIIFEPVASIMKASQTNK